MTMSYADAAAKGPKQSPEEAAAPQPPTIVPSDSSTTSLIDVNMPSVRTVSADFLDQDVQTVTQATRRKREEEGEAAAAKKPRVKKGRRSNARGEGAAGQDGEGKGENESWLMNMKQLAQKVLTVEDPDALMALNIAGAVGAVGVATVLGFKAWGLYQREQLSWQSVGAGVGVLATVGVVEALLASRLRKRKAEE